MLVLQHRVMWSILRKLLLQPDSNLHHILEYNSKPLQLTSNLPNFSISEQNLPIKPTVPAL